MMLRSITTQNYRNLRLESEIQFQRLAIFVGPNGSGKSNLVRVLSFFQDAITGSPDDRRGVNSFEDALTRFGSGRILDASVQMPAVVSFGATFSLQSEIEFVDTFELELLVQNENTVTIQREEMYRKSLVQPLKPEYYYIAHVAGLGDASVRYARNGDQGFVLMHNVPTSQLAFNSLTSRLQRYIQGVKEDKEENVLPEETVPTSSYFEARERILDYVGGWTFYESARMNLDRIRHSNPELGMTDSVLSSSGDNLSIVLYNLTRDNLDFEDRIAEAMRELFPRTRRLRVLPVGRLTLQIEWRLEDRNRPFYLDEMSDGTVRMLCWAIVLLSPQRSSLIVIDEPEAGIHPAWLRVLAGWIKEAARETQVIVSTHSSDLLDYFTDNIENVYVFRPDKEDPLCNRVAQLKPEEFTQKLSEGWQLGDLYRVADPILGGWPW